MSSGSGMRRTAHVFGVGAQRSRGVFLGVGVAQEKEVFRVGEVAFRDFGRVVHRPEAGVVAVVDGRDPFGGETERRADAVAFELRHGDDLAAFGQDARHYEAAVLPSEPTGRAIGCVQPVFRER